MQHHIIKSFAVLALGAMLLTTSTPRDSINNAVGIPVISPSP